MHLPPPRFVHPLQALRLESVRVIACLPHALAATCMRACGRAGVRAASAAGRVQALQILGQKSFDRLEAIAQGKDPWQGTAAPKVRGTMRPRAGVQHPSGRVGADRVPRSERGARNGRETAPHRPAPSACAQRKREGKGEGGKSKVRPGAKAAAGPSKPEQEEGEEEEEEDDMEELGSEEEVLSGDDEGESEEEEEDDDASERCARLIRPPRHPTLSIVVSLRLLQRAAQGSPPTRPNVTQHAWCGAGRGRRAERGAPANPTSSERPLIPCGVSQSAANTGSSRHQRQRFSRDRCGVCRPPMHLARKPAVPQASRAAPRAALAHVPPHPIRTPAAATAVVAAAQAAVAAAAAARLRLNAGAASQQPLLPTGPAGPPLQLTALPPLLPVPSAKLAAGASHAPPPPPSTAASRAPATKPATAPRARPPPQPAAAARAPQPQQPQPVAAPRAPLPRPLPQPQGSSNRGRGVTWNEAQGMWEAVVYLTRGGQLPLGLFNDEQEALERVKAAAFVLEDRCAFPYLYL